MVTEAQRKAKRKYDSSELGKATNKAYEQRPDVKEKRRLKAAEVRATRPDVIEYRKRWREANQDKIKARSLARSSFKGEAIYNKDNPRTGICSVCGKTSGELGRQTVLHHLQYDEVNPLAYLVEVCQGCHSRLHAKGNPV